MDIYFAWSTGCKCAMQCTYCTVQKNEKASLPCILTVEFVGIHFSASLPYHLSFSGLLEWAKES